MKTKKLLVTALTAVLLGACSKEAPEGPTGGAENKPLEVALNSFTYGSLMTDLSERSSLGEVILRDGDLTRSVSLTASDNLDPDQADALVFTSAEADSVDLTVSSGYVAVRMTVGGRQKAWIAYDDPETQEAVEARYASLGAATKSGPAVMTRSAVDGGKSGGRLCAAGGGRCAGRCVFARLVLGIVGQGKAGFQTGSGPRG